MKDDKNTPEVEVKTPEAEVTEEVVTEETIGEMAGKPDDGTVDRNVFVSEKKARKQAEKELKALKESIEKGASAKDVSNDIGSIADEHNIDPKFLQDFANTIRSQAEEGIEDRINSKFDSYNNASTFEKKFGKAYETAIDRGPEFKEIANPEVIKALSKLPENSKKTVSQILEETYGNAITGKATIETTKPGGGKDPEPLDYDKAQRDGAYFAEVMADPEKKEQYNSMMLKKGF